MASPPSFPRLAREWFESAVVSLATSQESLDEVVDTLGLLNIPPELLTELRELQYRLHAAQLQVLQVRNAGPLDFSERTRRSLQARAEVPR